MPQPHWAWTKPSCPVLAAARTTAWAWEATAAFEGSCASNLLKRVRNVTADLFCVVVVHWDSSGCSSSKYDHLFRKNGKL